MTPTFYIKNVTQNTPEITNNDITPGLLFLGCETSPVFTNNYTTNSGVDGSTFNNTLIGQSVINAKFELFTIGHYDMDLARHDIYKLFAQKDLFRIRTDTSPAKVAFVRAGSFSITPAKNGSKQALITIPFDNPSGYFYSLLTSDNLMTYEAQGWAYGMNLPNGQDLTYRYNNQTQFSIYNASDITIDPYYQKHQLQIIIKHNGGSFYLENKTTGDYYRYNNSMNSNDTLLIDGINTYKNKAIVDNKTNYSYLTLRPGYNVIETNATDLDILFSFPFIYLA